jgi:CRP-like cAMP-binding protein
LLPTPSVFAANRLLADLPAKEREQLLAHCDSIQLHFAEVLYRSGDLISTVYFPTGSFISLVTPLGGDAGLEVGMIGNEGMLGITLTLGIDIAPFQAIVQGSGSALCITAAAFTHELERSPQLRRLLKRYLYISISQLAQSAACCRIHVVEERLARWLLMTQDRAHADAFHITHLFLAYMLGVAESVLPKQQGRCNDENSLATNAEK